MRGSKAAGSCVVMGAIYSLQFPGVVLRPAAIIHGAVKLLGPVRTSFISTVDVRFANNAYRVMQGTGTGISLLNPIALCVYRTKCSTE